MQFSFVILSLFLVFCSGEIRPNRIKLTFNPFQICLKNVTKVTKFGYHANVNSILEEAEKGQLHGEMNEPVNGTWCLINDIKIAPGDTVNYYTYALRNGQTITSTILSKTRQRNSNKKQPQFQIDQRYQAEEVVSD